MKEKSPRVMVVESRFYEDIADHLLNGAESALRQAGVGFDVFTVPGALEIPAVMKAGKGTFDAFVALGCVIRGETSHYDIVAGESARALMALSMDEDMAIGNGILTCETHEQAVARAHPAQKNKGADAVEAALSILGIKRRLAILSSA